MAVAQHPRAKTDDELKALRDKDGFLGVVAVPFFLAPNGGATLDRMLRHIDHACEIVGLERVGIATDWGGWSPELPAEFVDASLETFRRLDFRQQDLPQLGVAMPEFAAWESWPNISAAFSAEVGRNGRSAVSSA